MENTSSHKDSRANPQPLQWVILFALLVVPPACRGEPESDPVDLLVRGGTVVTMDDDYRVFDPGYVAIDGGVIVAAGSWNESQAFPARETIDARGKLVLPGLINAHQHAPMALLRGIADDLPLMEWLQQFIFPAEAEHVDREFVYWGTLLAAFEMISTGTTTFADMYFFEAAVAEATIQSGMRGVLGQTVIGFPAPDHRTPEEALAAAEVFIREWKGNEQVTPAVAPHAPYTCSREVLVACRDLAERYDVPLLIHLAETRTEVDQLLEQTGRRPIQYLADIGFLSRRVVAAHVVWPSPEEIQILKEFNVGVVHNPESNMKLVSGISPVPEMLKAGVTVALGTDGPASNNNLDLFEEMDSAAKLHKVHQMDATVMSARQTLTLATRGGARVLGMADQIGSLEAGKQADLIIVGMSSVEAEPLFDPYSVLVYSLKGGAVETVIIGGRIVMQDRNVLTLSRHQIVEKAREYARRLKSN